MSGLNGFEQNITKKPIARKGIPLSMIASKPEFQKNYTSNRTVLGTKEICGKNILIQDWTVGMMENFKGDEVEMARIIYTFEGDDVTHQTTTESKPILDVLKSIPEQDKENAKNDGGILTKVYSKSNNNKGQTYYLDTEL